MKPHSASVTWGVSVNRPHPFFSVPVCPFLVIYVFVSPQSSYFWYFNSFHYVFIGDLYTRIKWFKWGCFLVFMCVSPALLPDLHCPYRWQHTCAVYSLRTKQLHSDPTHWSLARYWTTVGVQDWIFLSDLKLLLLVKLGGGLSLVG